MDASEVRPQNDGESSAGRPGHAARAAGVVDVPRISPWLWRGFGRYAECYLARHFHAVRLSRAGGLPPETDAPLVVYLNHPSWWDPLVCLLLARRLFPDRWHYAPIEASALGRYWFFRRLGFFGIEAGTRKGAATFLRVGRAILSRPMTGLWVTAEGRFTDPRQRPVRLQPGLSHAVQHLGRGVLLPLALEYPFWEERGAEVLVRFGEGIAIDGGGTRRVSAWTALLEQRLEATMDALCVEACRRDLSAFEALLHGRTGIAGPYDAWRGLRAYIRGESFHRTHGEADR
jgi:1-acyl-sn-glycerol-3-phosphate acyltransferase